MKERGTYQIPTWFIAAVWLTNGLVCKVLNMVPRRQEIVAVIFGNGDARLLVVKLWCRKETG
jgi:hypothetical protein